MKSSAIRNIIKVTMKAHYIQHVPFEGPGHIEKWLKKNKYEITDSKLYEKFSFPDIASIDFLIIMGGPMSANDEDIIQWLRQEKKFIYEYMQTGKPVLGICLGAQLIADVLGSKVYKNEAKEIGWFKIKHSFNISEMKNDNIIEAFHWHGETFDLPGNSIRLAESKGCANQAFRYKENVYGFQFHLEVTPETVDEMLLNCGNEIKLEKYVQNIEEIKRLTKENYIKANLFLENILLKIVSNS